MKVFNLISASNKHVLICGLIYHKLNMFVLSSTISALACYVQLFILFYTIELFMQRILMGNKCMYGISNEKHE